MPKFLSISIFALAFGCGGADSADDAGGGASGNGAGQGGKSVVELPQGGLGGGGGGAPKCTRAVSLSAVAIERPEPFDVIIVADHSGSLSWSRDSLSRGLSNLLDYAHGQEVRFFVLTPTQYGASSSLAVTAGNVPLVVCQDPVTHLPYEHAITEYRQVCTDVNGGAVDCTKRHEAEGKGLSVKGTWEFQMPKPIAAITPEMSNAEIITQQKKIADAILALGSDGAQLEQPICTLNRYIAQERSRLPAHAVFLVLSDEDDQSTPEQCLSSYSYQEHADGTNDSRCQADCDVFRYTADYWRSTESVNYDCVPVDDQGVHHPENASRHSTSSSAGATCVPGSMRDCNAEHLALASKFCNTGNVPENCKVSCSAASGFSCSLDRPTMGQDLCTSSFVENGVSYANIADYCQRTHGGVGPWQNCRGEGYDLATSTRYIGEEKVVKLVDVPNLSGMAAHFRARADAIFGASSYFVESIVLDPSFPCPVKSGQSYGTTLKALATSPEDVFPLCSDYAPALQRIRSFAHRLIQNQFALTLASDEEIDSVSAVTLNGERRKLNPADYTYDRDAKQLRIVPGVLSPSDLTLDLQIADTCIEIVR
ncbi:MAG: hypothetical protein ACOY0T_20065 [Myxococcota bacterium]